MKALFLNKMGALFIKPKNRKEVIANKLETRKPKTEIEIIIDRTKFRKLRKLEKIPIPLKRHLLDFDKNAVEGKNFVLFNGKILRNLNELLTALKEMDKYTFVHHINNEKNDFSNWIKHVFEYNQLADKVNKAVSKKEIIKILEESKNI